MNELDDDDAWFLKNHSKHVLQTKAQGCVSDMDSRAKDSISFLPRIPQCMTVINVLPQETRCV